MKKSSAPALPKVEPRIARVVMPAGGTLLQGRPFHLNNTVLNGRVQPALFPTTKG